MKPSILAIVCVICSSLSTATALAHPTNNTSTRSYLQAELVYLRGVYRDSEPSAAAIEARANQIAGACPAALTYAPRDSAFSELDEEIDTTLAYVGEVPVRSSTLRLAGSLSHLAWTDRALTRLVYAQAVDERAIATLALPEVCSQIAAWKASAYAVLPQTAHGFVAHVNAIESGYTIGSSEEPREVAVMRMLRPYETPADRRTAAMVKRLSAATKTRAGTAVAAARKSLAVALGVSTL